MNINQIGLIFLNIHRYVGLSLQFSVYLLYILCVLLAYHLK